MSRRRNRAIAIGVGAAAISALGCLMPVLAAEPVRIIFAQTSYCSGYAGESNLFVIGLLENQDLVIGPNKPIQLSDPLGNELDFTPDEEGHSATWKTTKTGDYIFRTRGAGPTFFKICAFDTPEKTFYPKDKKVFPPTDAV